MNNQIIENIKLAENLLRSTTAKQRESALQILAEKLQENKEVILTANNKDLDAVATKKDAAFIDRMTFTDTNFQAMIDGVLQVKKLDDIIGVSYDQKTQDSGIKTKKMRVPIGAILMIYESRPNVTIDAAALAIKSGNVIILKGGSETNTTNSALAKVIHDSLDDAGLPPESIQVITDNARETTTELLKRNDVIDLLIHRGSRKLLEFVEANSKIPLLMHLEGNCHTYIDSSADKAMAIKVAINAKTRRYGICGATEKIIIHEKVAREVLPELANQLREHSVEIRADDKARKIIDSTISATEADWSEEYLAPIIAIKIVSSLDEAIEHINTYGSAHTDAIIASDQKSIDKFVEQVDSSSVLVNTSTQFADGFMYGLGAEIGISTGKLHARGPVGLEGLTTYKWVVESDGNIRS